jgi:hypothetical protein
MRKRRKRRGTIVNEQSFLAIPCGRFVFDNLETLSLVYDSFCTGVALETLAIERNRERMLLIVE